MTNTITDALQIYILWKKHHYLNWNSYMLSCYWVTLVVFLFVCISWLCAESYIQEDNLALMNLNRMTVLKLKFRIRESYFSATGVTSLRTIFIEGILPFDSWIIHEQMLIFTSSVVIWNCLYTLYKHIATSGLFVNFFLFYYGFQLCKTECLLIEINPYQYKKKWLDKWPRCIIHDVNSFGTK